MTALQWAIAARRAAVIAFLAITVGEGAAGEAFFPTSRTATIPSSSGAIAAAPDSPLPANLVVPDIVRPLVISMRERSPTFRRQCARLAEHDEVIVDVKLLIGVSNGRAQSLVKRDQGHYHVVVLMELRTPSLYVEYVAHELEHVLEAVDGTDLPRLARQRVDGVINLGGHYETARAQAVGWIVAREVMP